MAKRSNKKEPLRYAIYHLILPDGQRERKYGVLQDSDIKLYHEQKVGVHILEEFPTSQLASRTFHLCNRMDDEMARYIKQAHKKGVDGEILRGMAVIQGAPLPLGVEIRGETMYRLRAVYDIYCAATGPATTAHERLVRLDHDIMMAREAARTAHINAAHNAREAEIEARRPKPSTPEERAAAAAKGFTLRY